jgi:hypothetical protein
MFLKIKMRIIICILAEFGVVNYNVEKNQFQGKTDNHKKSEVARLQRIAKLSA